MVLLQDFDCGCIRYLCVFDNFNTSIKGPQCETLALGQKNYSTHGFSPSSKTYNSYRLGAFMMITN